MYFAEPIQVYSGIPDNGDAYTPLNMRRQLTVNQGTKTSTQQKPGNNCLVDWIVSLLLGWLAGLYWR